LLGGAVPPPPEHPRLPQTVLAGQREILVAGHLSIPQKLLRKKRMPLLVHFHGAAWVAETAAAKHRQYAALRLVDSTTPKVAHRREPVLI
jgi:hypothetical protein